MSPIVWARDPQHSQRQRVHDAAACEDKHDIYRPPDLFQHPSVEKEAAKRNKAEERRPEGTASSQCVQRVSSHALSCFGKTCSFHIAPCCVTAQRPGSGRPGRCCAIASGRAIPALPGAGWLGRPSTVCLEPKRRNAIGEWNRSEEHTSE